MSNLLGTELSIEGPTDGNPYLTDMIWVEFDHPNATDLRRSAFWDGTGWKVRANLPREGTWTWTTTGGQTGTVEAPAPRPLLTLSPKGRNFQWTDGTPYLVVADTAWALPFRATLDQTREYAEDRRAKGFNAVMLMTIQPDTGATGPEDRTAYDGFARGFDDAHNRTLTQLRPDYFRHLDAQIEILLSHGIVPIHTPLFFGFGWKGLAVNGPRVPVADAERFALYLLARYGAAPAIWQVGADGTGWEPNTEAMGQAIHRHDAYAQPTGIHYNPWQTNEAHWDADWCDFHLAQTGHNGEHRPEVVTEMHLRNPVRAVANGEPTYEGMQGGKTAVGRWQHTEAWLSFMAGGTLGVWYGAGSLWQWKHAGENTWDPWCVGPFDWRTAMSLEGSTYPGVVAKGLAAYDACDLSPSIKAAHGRRALVKPNELIVAYLETGGGCAFEVWEPGLPWAAFDALTGEPIETGTLSRDNYDPYMGERIQISSQGPTVVVVGRPRDA